MTTIKGIENTKESVCAVLVTYNRKELLIECLNGLLAQTRPIDAVVIVNNASTDGTEALLYEEGYLSNLPTLNESIPWQSDCKIYCGNKSVDVIYLQLPVNTGGAGGFYEGVKKAQDAGYDWFWLMDDDVEPETTCLEVMLEYKNISGCIHPRKQYLDGSYFNWYGFFNPSTGRLKPIEEKSIWPDSGYVEVNYGCFEGMLISSKVVSKIGLPNPDYFISYDDRIYGFKASLVGKVIYINKAIFKKKIKKNNPYESSFSIFYLIRNLYVLQSELKKDGIGGISLESAFYIAFFSAKILIKSKKIIPVIKANIAGIRWILQHA